jgi:hypothetical protein
MPYRVWIHPKKGDDYAKHFKSPEGAAKFASKNKNAEDVVYHTRGNTFRAGEAPVFRVRKGMNFTRVRRKR